MQTVSFIKHKILFALLCAMVVQQNLFPAACGPTTPWTGSVGPATYTDTNINITGDVQINGLVVVHATTCDPVISMSAGAKTVKGFNASTPQLFLQADAGRTITVNVTDDLTFQGADDGSPMLIAFVGSGTVQFTLYDGKTLSFTSNGVGGGAARAFTAADGTLVQFARANTNSAANVTVAVGKGACLSYVGNGAGTGNMTWYTGNANPAGAFILAIANQGLVGLQVVNTAAALLPGSLTLAAIDLTTLDASATAIFELVNDTVGATNLGSLQIQNSNTHLTDYRANPFCLNNWYDQFGGAQYGFILGANAVFDINSLTYLDYIGLANNANPTPNIPAGNVQAYVQDLKEDGVISNFYDLIKPRNPSAFIIDGDASNPSLIAQINMTGDSAIYFRSGVDEDGVVLPDFTVDPTEITQGPGEYVLDVEGEVNINGSNNPGDTNGLNILSWQVNPTGCPVDTLPATCPATVNPNSGNLNFPSRTFATDRSGGYLQYNRAAFLINNRMNFNAAFLIHTDENHDVFERITLLTIGVNSQPTYVGGESFKLCASMPPRPTIALYAAPGGAKPSEIRFHTSAGFTGVDVRVPNQSGINLCALRFYTNGYCIDQGYGRYAIFGMDTGAYGQTGCVLIDNDAHLDVYEDDFKLVGGTSQTLQLVQDFNTTCVTPGITANITGQRSVHTIFLGNNSNITVGGTIVNPAPTPSNFLINGDFFSFETQGGAHRFPETSSTTGQGGIFVDQNGTFGIANGVACPSTPCGTNYRANISTMVTKSGNGIINLPKNQVFFDTRIGIAEWNLDLTPTNSVVIAANQNLSEYNLDWGAAQKYCVDDVEGFVPYELQSVPGTCCVPPVIGANLTAIPTINGEVDQLNIKRSRLGDMVHLLVDGGLVRELVFLRGGNTAEAPMGFLVVANNGTIGLNTAFRNVDSTLTSGILGVNGLTLVADGDGVFELNEDVEVDNVCHILPGPHYTTSNLLQFHSHEVREFRIRSGAVLDMSQFTAGMKIQFTGQVHMIFEPGSKWVLGGGTVIFTDKTHLSLERVTNLNLFNGTALTDLDPIRVKFLGTGILTFNEYATLDALHNTIMTIGTDVATCPVSTNITVNLNDQASFQIGNDGEPGGVFEVGNSSNQVIAGTPTTVNFTLNINGQGAMCQVNRQGMLGLGVGIVNKVSTVPAQWFVGTLFNVGTITMNVTVGTFAANQIEQGNQPNVPSLIAFGSTGTFNFTINNNTASMLGGSNMLQTSIAPASLTIFNPPVFDVNGAITVLLNAGIISSLPMLQDTKQASLPNVTQTSTTISCTGATPFNMFTFLQVKTVGTPQNGQQNGYNQCMACIAPNQVNRARIAYVDGINIARIDNFLARGGAEAGLQTSFNHAYGHGAVGFSMLYSPTINMNSIDTVTVLHRNASASSQAK